MLVFLMHTEQSVDHLRRTDLFRCLRVIFVSRQYARKITFAALRAAQIFRSHILFTRFTDFGVVTTTHLTPRPAHSYSPIGFIPQPNHRGVTRRRIGDSRGSGADAPGTQMLSVPS